MGDDKPKDIGPLPLSMVSHIEYSSKHTLEGRTHSLVDNIIKVIVIKPVREERHRFRDINFTAPSDFIGLILSLPLSLALPSRRPVTQHINNHLVKVPVILMVQSSLLVFGHFFVFGQI